MENVTSQTSINRMNQVWLSIKSEQRKRKVKNIRNSKVKKEGKIILNHFQRPVNRLELKSLIVARFLQRDPPVGRKGNSSDKSQVMGNANLFVPRKLKKSKRKLG